MINRIRDLDAPGNGYRPFVAGGGRPRGVGGELPPLGDVGKRIERFIGDHPVMSLAVGLTIGIVIGCLIKRR